MFPPSGLSTNASRAEVNGLRLLVVDDHVDSADSLALLLAAWGHRPRVAYDASSALTIARTETLDGVILDLRLPGRNGFDIAKDIRQQDGLSRLPLIALTGFGDRAHRQKARAAGIDHFFVKPVDPEVLQQLLQELKRSARLTGRMDHAAEQFAALARQATLIVDETRAFITILLQSDVGANDGPAI